MSDTTANTTVDTSLDTPLTRRLIVGYAGTWSMPALDWAVHEAELRSASVCLVGCYHLPFEPSADSIRSAVADAERLEKTTREDLEFAAERMRHRHPQVDIAVEAVPGPPHTALTSLTAHADLLVLGSHLRDSSREFWLARTARQTARHSSCPLVVVRQPNTSNYLRRIVVGVDGWDASAAALAWAADEAELHRVELLVAHAWVYPYAGMGPRADRAEEMTRCDANLLLESAAADARLRCTSTVSTQLIESGPASALLGVVRDRDLLVVGSRGRGPLRAAIFGSTTNTLLETSPVSTVVVRDAATNAAHVPSTV